MAIWTQNSMFGEISPITIKVVKRRKPRKRRLVGRILNLGAGLQSSTLAEMVIAGQLPHLDLAIFADTGDEPEYVYEQVRHLEGRLADIDVPLIIVRQSENGIVHDSMYGQGRFASMPVFTRNLETGEIGRLRRQCTNEYKIRPAHDYVLDWLLDRGYAKVVSTSKGSRRRVDNDVYIESWFGFSLDEWHRMSRGKLPAWQKQVCPLVDLRMTRQHCEEWLIQKGLRVPQKSSCRVCTYRKDSGWLKMATQYPEDFRLACEFDDWLRSPEAAQRLTMNLEQPVYLHQECIPLSEVDFEQRVKADTKPDLFSLCSGSCMT